MLSTYFPGLEKLNFKRDPFFHFRISQRVAKMNVTKRMSTNLQQVALDGQVSMDQAQWP